MALTKYERLNTFKTQVQFISGSTYVDPSGNLAYLKVYDPNGDVLARYNNVSGIRTSLGTYKYYISTSATDDLGIYKIEWRGDFNYSNPWDFMPKYEKEAIQLVDVIQG